MSEPASPDQDVAFEDVAFEATAVPEADETPRRGALGRVLRPLVLVLTAQYTIVLLIGLSVAGTVRTLLLPQILTSFETITAALRRAPF
jgi:hypothetical protein